jgi:hypothetical protein
MPRRHRDGARVPAAGVVAVKPTHEDYIALLARYRLERDDKRRATLGSELLAMAHSIWGPPQTAGLRFFATIDRVGGPERKRA